MFQSFAPHMWPILERVPMDMVNLLGTKRYLTALWGYPDLPYYIVFAFAHNIGCFTIHDALHIVDVLNLTSQKGTSHPKSITFIEAQSAILLYGERQWHFSVLVDRNPGLQCCPWNSLLSL